MVLAADDLLPFSPHRVLVAGTTGSGKTTLAGRVGRKLGVEHVEIDSLFHGPNWEPRASFVEDVDRFTSQPAWVTEWQYGAVRDLLAARAEVLVWLDLPRAVARTRLLTRTFARRLRRTELWNGNIEPSLATFFTRPDENILRWEMKTHRDAARQVPAALEAHPHLIGVRLRSQREVEAWLAGLPPA